MMRRLANLVLLLVAVAFCYGLQISKPHYADLIGPIPVRGKVGDTIVGRSFEVLFEKTGRHAGQIVGRSPYLQPVQVMAPAIMIGDIAAVTITYLGANSLFGALAETRIDADAMLMEA